MAEMKQVLEIKGILECYVAAGLVFGTVTLGHGASAAAVACSAGQHFCVKPSADSDVSSCRICSVMQRYVT